LKLDDATSIHRYPSKPPQSKTKGSQGKSEAEQEAGRHGTTEAGSGKEQQGPDDKQATEKCSGPEDKKDQQHRRGDPFDRQKTAVPEGEKEGLKTNPELKSRQFKDPKLVDPATIAAKKSEPEKRDERFDAQTVPNSVFGQDRVTLSPEVQMPPAVTRKSEAVGVKRGRQKYLPPGLNKLAAKANPAPTPPPFQDFLNALVKNFS
jgi:hypothetical protein